jgi:hypothetical protein
LNAKTLLALGSALAVSALAYAGLRDVGFTATDTFAEIECGRFESAGGVLRTFAQPLFAGTAFVEHHLYFRPVVGLTFGADWALWGLHAPGYHLTNVLIHLANVALVFALALELIGELRTAWIAALLFGLHPIHEAVVPAIVRRQDSLAAMFVLASLVLYFRGARRPGRSRGCTALSLAAFALALLSKELAILVPLLVFAGAWIFELPAGAGSRSWARAARATVPYAAVALVYVLWRTWVLRGLGGSIDRSLSGVEIAQEAAQIPYRFGRWLVDPTMALGAPTALVLRFVVPLLLLGALAFRLRRKGARPDLGLGFAFALLCSLALWFPEALPGLLRKAGASSYHVQAAREALPALALAALVAAAALAIALAERDRLARFLLDTPRGRAALLCCVWLAVSPLVFLAALVLSPRSLYLPAVPFCALVAIALVECLQVRGRIALASAGLTLIVAALLFAPSPLFRGHTKWRESAHCSELFLQALDGAAAKLPPGATLHLRGVPSLAVADSDADPYGVASGNVTGLSDYSIESWLALAHERSGGPRRRVVVESWVTFRSAPSSVTIATESASESQATLVVQAKP